MAVQTNLALDSRYPAPAIIWSMDGLNGFFLFPDKKSSFIPVRRQHPFCLKHCSLSHEKDISNGRCFFFARLFTEWKRFLSFSISICSAVNILCFLFALMRGLASFRHNLHCEVRPSKVVLLWLNSSVDLILQQVGHIFLIGSYFGSFYYRNFCRCTSFYIVQSH